MSDHEFDNYLALLSRLLRLGDKQRESIAGELRAHLEDRLDDLMSRGVPREQAVRQALEEFGDAAGLAAEFVSLSGKKRKRWIMRLTTASVAAIVLIAAGIFTFWPGGNAGPGVATLVAQAPAAADPNAETKPTQKRQVVEIKDALDQRVTFEFEELPLVEATKKISQQTGILIHVDAKRLEEAGVSIDTPITKGFPNIRLSAFLDLTLGDLELTYLTKDDVLVITTPEYAETERVIRVYDCRELLELPRPVGSIRPRFRAVAAASSPCRTSRLASRNQPTASDAAAPAAEGAGAAPAAGSASRVPGAAGGAMGGGGFGGFSGGPTMEEISDAENLISFITTTVDPDSWADAGGPGSIAEYKGLISVASTQVVHEKVERLLNMLHQAANLKELKVTVVE